MAISAQGSSTNLVFKTVNTERMRIDSAGKVGIGTTNPSSKLDVDGIITALGGNSTEWNLAYDNQGNYLPLIGGTLTGALTGTTADFSGAGSFGGNISASASGSTYLIATRDVSGSEGNFYFGAATNSNDIISRGAGTTSKDLTFIIGATAAMRIDSGGKVGIGTTNPSSKLDVDGIITATGGNSTEWNTAYSNQGNYLPLAGGTLTGTLTGTSSNFYNVTTDILKVNWKHYDGSNSPGTSGQVLSSTGSSTKWITLSGISGSGTTNYIPKFTAAGAIGNSQIIDTGIYVGINQASPNHMLDVTGEINVTGEYFLNGEGIIASGTHKIYVGDWDGNGFDTTILGSNGSQTLTVRGTSVGINETAPTSKLHVNGILEYQNNDGALDAGLTAGAFYRTGDLLKVVH
jgi:hypothetical protein